MPYTTKQNKLFRAAEHNPAIASAHGMSMSEAHKMALEGATKKRIPKKTLLHREGK